MKKCIRACALCGHCDTAINNNDIVTYICDIGNNELLKTWFLENQGKNK